MQELSGNEKISLGGVRSKFKQLLEGHRALLELSQVLDLIRQALDASHNHANEFRRKATFRVAMELSLRLLGWNSTPTPLKL